VKADSDHGRTRDERSIGELIGDVTGDLALLFRQEVELAKAEMKQEVGAAGRAAALFGAATLAGLLAAALLSAALVFGLAGVVPPGWAALIVAVLWAVVGYVLYAGGRARLARRRR